MYWYIENNDDDDGGNEINSNVICGVPVSVLESVMRIRQDG